MDIKFKGKCGRCGSDYSENKLPTYNEHLSEITCEACLNCSCCDLQLDKCKENIKADLDDAEYQRIKEDRLGNGE